MAGYNWKCVAAVIPLRRAKRAYPGRANPGRYSSRCPQILRFEGLFGAVNKNPEVFTGHTKIAAHLIFIPLLEKEGLQQATVLSREFVESLPHLLLNLPPGNGFSDTDGRIQDGIDHLGIGRYLPASRSIMLM